MNELSTINAKLEYQVEAAYTELTNLKSIPQLGGDPEKIDVTNLSDTSRRYIPGVEDPGDMVFGFFYDSGDSSAFWTLQTLKAAGTTESFKITLGDGTTVTFDAIVGSVRTNAMEVNGAVEYEVVLMPQGELTWTEAA